jgi:putative pyruvate formate lyase activating enzyme
MTAVRYPDLHRTGELARRIESLRALLSPCRLCPHECGVNRLAGDIGICRIGAGAHVSASTAHFGEEPEISGTRGSGTLFFASCNLHCVYCQNAAISQVANAAALPFATAEQIGDHMLARAAQGCHNVNWVTPSHVVPFAVEGLASAAARGLDLPLVYNTSGYDSVETLRLLDGVVDVYLADLRYADAATADELSGAPDYPEAARAAVLEMARQVGTANAHDPWGSLRRGLILRLLVLPNDLADLRETLAFVRDSLGTGVRIALMSQYFPTHEAASHDLLSRRVHHGEYARAIDQAERMGFDNLLVQELEASDFYRPDFDAGPEPFADAAHFRKDDRQPR